MHRWEPCRNNYSESKSSTSAMMKDCPQVKAGRLDSHLQATAGAGDLQRRKQLNTRTTYSSAIMGSEQEQCKIVR